MTAERAPTRWSCPQDDHTTVPPRCGAPTAGSPVGCEFPQAHLKVFPATEVTLPWQKPGGRSVSVRLMFTKDDEGAIWRNDWNHHAWRLALKVTGIAPGRKAGFHQLRYRYASLLLADGIDIRTLAEYLGHTDLASPSGPTAT